MEKGKTHINLGKWTQDILDDIIRTSAGIKETGERVNFLSKLFLGVDYAEATLIGDARAPEVFVINLAGVDCFTFIDYVEAMRRSGTFNEFEKNLKKVRYRNGEIAFENRNHFFTDWREYNPAFIEDVTEKIGAQKTRRTIKSLNLKEDGTFFLQGIQPRQREVSYIPSETIDDSVLCSMHTGDYAGIYSALPGMDVSHAGIVINDRGTIYLRHASSGMKYRKVVDQDLRNYMYDKTGLIIFRPRDDQRE